MNEIFVPFWKSINIWTATTLVVNLSEAAAFVADARGIVIEHFIQMSPKIPVNKVQLVVS